MNILNPFSKIALTIIFTINLGIPAFALQQDKPEVKIEITDEDIKNELFDIASENQRTNTYREARTFMFGELDIVNENKHYIIESIYCGINFNSDNLPSIGPNRIPKHTVLNTEHSWPQSKFSNAFNKQLQKSDLHHLFPSKSKANSIRSNIPFGEITKNRKDASCSKSSRGLNEFGDDVFEPRPEVRGDIARALFYFSVRYRKSIPNNEEVFLRKWHKEDPVSSKELIRHNKISEYQNNINPFILDPELTDIIDNF